MSLKGSGLTYEDAWADVAPTIPSVGFHLSINARGSKFTTIEVRDQVKTEVLTVHCALSNSGGTLRVGMSGVRAELIMKEWDEPKVLARVLYAFYVRANSSPKLQHLERLYKGIKMNRFDVTDFPAAVDRTVGAVHNVYLASRGEDAKREWDHIRKLMTHMSKRGVGEDEILKVWREVLVTEVHES
jgi:hypothetical protein